MADGKWRRRRRSRRRTGRSPFLSPGERDLKAPLAVLHGADDELINARYFASLAMPTLWRGAVQTISGAGHAPQWETPEAFDALIEAFIAKTA
jgi:pimeloyl-ACP methyl ester carboxylesterase